MGRSTLIVLVALVGGLVLAVTLRDRERAEMSRPDELLFPGLDPRAVDRIEVDNLERGTRVVLERDGVGRWSMLVPVPYPASGGMLGTLLNALQETRGPVESAGAVDDAAFGFAPPRAVLVWRAGGVAHAAELGGDCIGEDRVFARAGGRVLRISRALFDAVQVPPDEYRERLATPIAAVDVVAFHRRGSLLRASKAGEDAAGEPVDLAFDATLEPEVGWVMPEPRARLDPLLVGFLLRDSAELRVDTFTADDPGDFSPWGLDEPRMTIEIEDVSGTRVTLLFGTREDGPVSVESAERWYARRAGYPHVWHVERRAVGLLSSPHREFVDTLLVRAQRDEIRGVELGATRLTRDPRGRWLVAGPGIEADGTEAVGAPADATRVADLLATLEQGRVESWLGPDVEAELADGVPLAVVRTDGRRLGGTVWPLPDGTARFRRFGDELVGIVGASVAALVKTDPATLRDRRIPFALEQQIAALELRAGDATARFDRDPDTGRWHRAGAGEADAGTALYRALEALQALDALAWIDAEAEPPADALELRVLAAPGIALPADVPTVLLFAEDDEAEHGAICRLPDGTAARVRGELVDTLRSLLRE